jgi:HEAT repeat protein
MLRWRYCLIIVSSLVAMLGTTADQCVRAEPKADQDAALARRIDDLIRRLGDRRFMEREHAQKELIELGEPALEPLRKATMNPDAEIATRAKACLPVLELNIKVADYAAGLRDARLEVRLKVAKGLVRLGDRARRAVPALVRALDDGDKDLRLAVIASLTYIGADSKPAVPKLIAIVEDTQTHEFVRRAAGECLGHIGPVAQEAVPALLHVLDTEKDFSLNWAARALGGIGAKDERVIPALLKLLDNPTCSADCATALALGRIGKSPSTVVPALVEMLKKNRRDPNEKDHKHAEERGFRREKVVLALQGFGPGAEPAVAALVEIVQDGMEERQTRMLAVEALGLIGPKAKAAVPALQALRKDRIVGESLEAEMSQALRAITGPEK